MQDVIDIASKAVKLLGFDYCGWRAKSPLPLYQQSNFTLHNTEGNVFKKESVGGLMKKIRLF